MAEKTTAEKAQEATPSNPVAVDLTERVTVYATASAPHHEEGEETKVAPVLAAKMIKNGWATEQPVKKTEAKK